MLFFIVSNNINSPGTLFMRKTGDQIAIGLWNTDTFCAGNEAMPTTSQKKENRCESESDTATISNQKKRYILDETFQ